jgi:prepilin-type N-terminal cleavage/methylation domain-containing protein
VGQSQVQLNKQKGFSLIELLVVIALLGIISLVAVPNIREWLVKKEMEKDLNIIMSIVKNVSNDIGNNLYEMGGVFFDNNNGNGLIVKVRHRGPDKYRSLTGKTCNNNDSEWELTDDTKTYSSSSASEQYSTFSNIRLDKANFNFCISKNFTVTYSGSIKFCHKEKNTNATCQLNSNNDPYYDLIIDRTGRLELLKYSYAKKEWNKQ